MLLTTHPGFSKEQRVAACNFAECSGVGRPRLPVVLAQAAPPAADIGRWRLVRTLGPENKEIVSIMRVADALKSDPDFAGLMIRCQDKGKLQIALVTIRPFPPRARPRISVSAGGPSMSFESVIVPPGSLLSLPDEAEVLARGAWQKAAQLDVNIDSEGEKIHGVVPLESLSPALGFLQANCP